MVLIWRPDAIMSGGADMLKDGPLISVTTIASAVVQIGMLALAARLARWPVGEYLGLVRAERRDAALIAIAILVVFLLGYDALTYLLGTRHRHAVPGRHLSHAPATAARCRCCGSPSWSSAPVAEEIMFRGFLFRGWVQVARAAPSRRSW